MGLCQVDDVKAAATGRLDTWGDDRIQEMIDAASAACGNYARREFEGPGEPEARVFRANAWWSGNVAVGDMAAPPSAVTWGNGQSVPVDEVEVVHREDGAITSIRLPGVPAGEAVTVTAVWGFPTPPADVREACVDTVTRWLGATPQRDRPDDGHSDSWRPAGALSFRARMLLEPYRRPVVA